MTYVKELNRMEPETMKPLVSVIMPTFNRETKIAQSIQSVIDQTCTDWELIIVDDKSADNSKKVIDEFVKKDSRIKYVYNAGKKGLPAARNCGIRNAGGKYIAFLDSDDRWSSQHLKNSTAVLEENNTEVSFALWYEVINGIKKPIDELEKEIFERGFDKFKNNTINNVIFFTNKNFYEHLLKEDFYCYHINSMVIKRSIINKNMVFNENMKSNEDIDFTFKAIMKYGFCLIKEYQYEYYYWDDSMYAFFDRRKQDIEVITKNSSNINKIVQHSKYKILYYKMRKKYVKGSDLIQDKKYWHHYFNQRIAKKYLTIAFLTENLNKGKGHYYYYLKSLFYHFNYDILKYIFDSLLPSKSDALQLNQSLFDFN